MHFGWGTGRLLWKNKTVRRGQEELERRVVTLHGVVTQGNIAKLYLSPVWYLGEESPRQRGNKCKTPEMKVCLVWSSRNKEGCVSGDD